MVEIPLLRGGVATIDKADLDLIAGRQWRSWSPDGRTFYAVTGGGRERIYMHRLILGLTTAKQRADHIDRDGLNNRRANLRLSDASRNGANRPGWGRTSRFKGVSASGRPNKPWMAAIKVNRCRINLGRFVDEEEAARAYDAAARKYFGEFAHLNFPSPRKDD
jgi:AP2 domain